MTEDERDHYRIDESSGNRDLVVTGAWSGAAEGVLRSGLADGLVLNYARGFKERSLDFVANLPIRRLVVLARTIKDLSPIYSLAATLEELSVTVAPTARIDVSELPRLRALSADWSQISRSLRYAVGVVNLYIGSYSEPDLEPLAENVRLERLVMKDRPGCRSLDGLGWLRDIRELYIGGARYLSDYSALSSASSLEILRLPSCGQFSDLADLSSCRGLLYLDLSDVGEVESLQHLEVHENLEELNLSGTVRVADGDLSPLLRLPKLRSLRMQSRKTYAPSVQEVIASLAAR